MRDNQSRSIWKRIRNGEQSGKKGKRMLCNEERGKQWNYGVMGRRELRWRIRNIQEEVMWTILRKNNGRGEIKAYFVEFLKRIYLYLSLAITGRKKSYISERVVLNLNLDLYQWMLRLFWVRVLSAWLCAWGSSTCLQSEYWGVWTMIPWNTYSDWWIPVIICRSDTVFCSNIRQTLT